MPDLSLPAPDLSSVPSVALPQRGAAPGGGVAAARGLPDQAQGAGAEQESAEQGTSDGDSAGARFTTWQ